MHSHWGCGRGMGGAHHVEGKKFTADKYELELNPTYQTQNS